MSAAGQSGLINGIFNVSQGQGLRDIITDFTVPAIETDPVLTDRQRRGINRDNALRLMPALRRAPDRGASPKDRVSP